MGLLRKDYYRLDEIAGELQCSVDDIFHHCRHDRIKLGIRVDHETLFGLNSDLRTIGAYSVSGVLNIVGALAQNWEFGASDSEEAPALIADPDYPPEITEASYIDEASVPPSFWTWAPGHDWLHPERDHRLIERFVVGVTFPEDDTEPGFDFACLRIDRSRVVVHAVERARILRTCKAGAAIPTDNKLLATIAALLAAWPGGKTQWPSAKDLEKAAQAVGVAISDDTIRKAIEAAQGIAPNLPK